MDVVYASMCECGQYSTIDVAPYCVSVPYGFVCISTKESIKRQARCTFNIRAAGLLLKVVISVFVFEKSQRVN